MSEEMKNNQPEKTGLDETRKSALLRYVAILFAVAFVLVLLSMLGQMRDSKTAITELSQSSSSAIAKAEQLQEENLELTQDKKFLQQQVEQLTADVEALQQEWEEQNKELEAAEEQQAKVLEAYEALLAAMESGKTENLEQFKEILGENGTKAYETLTKEVE